MKNSKKWILTTLVSLLILPVAATTVTVTEKQLNQQLLSQFPVEKTYQGLNVKFTDPKIRLDVLDKTIKIDTVIVAESNGESLTAKGLLTGKLEFDDIEQVLEFIKPKLEEFYLKQSEMVDPKPAVRIIKQSIDGNLDDIILIDFNHFDLRYRGITPTEIDIAPRGVVITL